MYLAMTYVVLMTLEDQLLTYSHSLTLMSMRLVEMNCFMLLHFIPSMEFSLPKFSGFRTV